MAPRLKMYGVVENDDNNDSDILSVRASEYTSWRRKTATAALTWYKACRIWASILGIWYPIRCVLSVIFRRHDGSLRCQVLKYRRAKRTQATTIHTITKTEKNKGKRRPKNRTVRNERDYVMFFDSQLYANLLYVVFRMKISSTHSAASSFHYRFRVFFFPLRRSQCFRYARHISLVVPFLFCTVFINFITRVILCEKLSTAIHSMHA